MTKPISIQLYTVRELMQADPWGTLQKIADMGYVGVEPYCIIGDVKEMARRLDDLGLQVSAAQTGKPVGDDANRLMDQADALQTNHIVCPHHNPEDFTSREGIARVTELFGQCLANTAERGLTFGYHNHEFELAEIDGTPALLHLAKALPDLKFTVDTYWVEVGGQDATAILETLDGQANLLHIKDGPVNKTDPHLAVGSGAMDFPPIIQAATSAEWLVVELDACATDMLTAVEQSIKYLVDEGLGHAK